MITPIEQVLQSPHIPKEEEQPVFAAPWEARAFGMTIKLYEAGKFEWTEWAAELTHQISLVEKTPTSETASYYECWVRALQEIILRKNIIEETHLEDVVAHTIANPPHPDHEAQREPIACSPAH